MSDLDYTSISRVSRLPKLKIVGHARHGKDTVAKLLEDFAGYKAISSSYAVCEAYIYERLCVKYRYKNVLECFDDRINHRAEWYDLIAEYNTPDKARTARLIYSKADIYIGIRCDKELRAAQDEKLIDLTIWVDASERLPLEPYDSMKITKDMADIIVDNNRTPRDLEQRIQNLAKVLRS